MLLQLRSGDAMNKRRIDNFQGCLIGGAIGDALGWPVEFMKLSEIKSRFGENGLAHLILSGDGKAQITDDTQMTMFTAEGLLRAESRLTNKGICHAPTVIYFAYQRWLVTQGYPKKKDLDFIYDGWLLKLNRLHASRAPGNSCITSLLKDEKGTIEKPINNSKGCGAVMRSAPFGLFLNKNTAFEMAVESAAFTHGHPTGQLAAGALAFLIAEIIEGQSIITAVFNTIEKLKIEDHSFECISKLEDAISLSQSDLSDIESISSIGEGWTGEEALGISVFCAVRHQNDFRKALVASINHSGDSDSTGAITGNILGAYNGIDSIPKEWIQNTELVEEVRQLANDLFQAYEDSDEWWNKYPGY